MSDITEDTIRTIVREEIAAAPVVTTMQANIATLQDDVALLKDDVAVLKDDVSVLKDDVSALKDEQRRQGVLLENLESKMDTVLEMLSANLHVKQQVDGYEDRLQKLEADNDMVKSTVALHSKSLVALGS